MPRSYGKISTSIWRSQKFKALGSNTDAKLLYLHLHTCQSVNSIGCFTLPLGYVAEDLGWQKDEVKQRIDSLSRVFLVEWNATEEVVRIINFVEHDPPTNPKHAKAIFKVAKELPDCSEKLRALMDLQATEYGGELSDLAAEIDRLSKAYAIGYPEKSPPYPIPEPIPNPLPGPSTASLRSEPAAPQADLPGMPSGRDEGLENPDFLRRGAQAPEAHKPTRSKPDRSELDQAYDAYNAAAERAGWPICQKRTGQRDTHLRKRLTDVGGLTGWLAALEKAAASDFLCGRAPPRDGQPPFHADIDFLTRESSFVKLMEGKYDNRGSTRNGPSAIDRATARAARDLAAGSFDQGGPDPGFPEPPMAARAA